MSNVVFDNRNDIETATEYLRVYGSSVRDVHFANHDWHLEMTRVALYCRKFTVLRLTSMTVNSSLRDVVWDNQSIQEIWLDSVVCADAGIFRNLSVPRVRMMHLANLNSSDGFPWHESTHCPCLQTVVIQESKIANNIKLDMNRRCRF